MIMGRGMKLVKKLEEGRRRFKEEAELFRIKL